MNRSKMSDPIYDRLKQVYMENRSYLEDNGTGFGDIVGLHIILTELSKQIPIHINNIFVDGDSRIVAYDFPMMRNSEGILCCLSLMGCNEGTVGYSNNSEAYNEIEWSLHYTILNKDRSINKKFLKIYNELFNKNVVGGSNSGDRKSASNK